MFELNLMTAKASMTCRLHEPPADRTSVTRPNTKASVSLEYCFVSDQKPRPENISFLSLLLGFTEISFYLDFCHITKLLIQRSRYYVRHPFEHFPFAFLSLTIYNIIRSLC